MMKRLLFVCIAAFVVVGTASAQLPNGSVAPNFTATDIDGNEHTLYDYLADGKTVVLDLSATWCGPCWSYHTGEYNGFEGEGALHHLWAENGPDGTDEVVIIMLEADDSTNSDDLIGTGSNTLGDWTEGVEYPIIDDAQFIFNLYDCGYYPTIFTICPNAILTESGQSTYEDHYAIVSDPSCELYANDATVTNYLGASAGCGDVDIIVEIVNLGTETVTDLNITVTGVMPELDYDWTGSLAQLESEEVNVGMATPVSGETVVITITTADDNDTNNSMMPDIGGATESSTHIHFSMLTDTYPSDYTVHILDLDGNEVTMAGPWAEYDVMMDPIEVEADMWVPGTGCYVVELRDQYGDGLYAGAWAQAWGVDANGDPMEIIYEAIAEVSFTEQSAAAEVTEVVSVEELDFVENLIVFPNPATDVVNVQFTATQSEQFNLTLYNLVGEKVMAESWGTLPIGQQTYQLNTSAIATGMYMLELGSASGSTTVSVQVR